MSNYVLVPHRFGMIQVGTVIQMKEVCLLDSVSLADSLYSRGPSSDTDTALNLVNMIPNLKLDFMNSVKQLSDYIYLFICCYPGFVYPVTASAQASLLPASAPSRHTFCVKSCKYCIPFSFDMFLQHNTL